MLTADLVRARRRGTELKLVALDAAAKLRAEAVAAALLDLAHAHVGKSRDELDEAWDAVLGDSHDRRLADGLAKLVDDRCTFEPDADVAPEELRRDVFTRASAARAGGGRVDRAAILAAVAAERGLAPDAVERGLYADLRGAHRLQAVEPISPHRLVEAYDLAQAQAVLLRAVRVVVDVECAAPGAYRALFHKLKFLRLLHHIAPRAEGGYRIEIDGPFSLFESSTKYGLSLALALPAIRACDRFELTADLRWGLERTPLTFTLAGGAHPDEHAPPHLSDEVATLLAGVDALRSPWRVTPATVVLDLPGVGVCVPDLRFEHRETGARVYLEVLGYWSRAAVWKRVELVERGLAGRLVFAVGQHLRVSEAALDAELPAALYVYKRTMLARGVLEAVEKVAAAPGPPAAELAPPAPADEPAPKRKKRATAARRAR